MDMTKNEEAYLASRPNSPPLKKGPFVHSRSLMANIACSTNLVTKPPPGSLSITLLCFFSLYFLLFSFYSSIVMQKTETHFQQMTSQARCHFRLSTPGTNLVVIQSPQDRPHLLHMSPLPYTRPGGRINIRRRKILLLITRGKGQT